MLKKKLILLVSLTILVSLSAAITSKYYSNFSPYTETKDPSIYNLKKGGSWDLTNISIFIDDSDPNYNWSKTVSENDWCSGTGTVSDPYLIENVTIDSYYSGTCIEIRNSNNFFRIQNCSLYNSGSGYWDGGVTLNNTSNGEITGCQFSNHNSHSILVRNSVNITIIKNNIKNCANGIMFLDSNNSLIAENYLYEISGSGVHFARSFENTIENNKIRHATNYNGVYLSLSGSANNSISGNIIGGIYLWDWESNIGEGIRLRNSNATTITENIFIHISDCIFLEFDSSNNFLYKNYFNSNNIYPCRDLGIDNSWDNGSIGNYWRYYTYITNGYDSNDDGIGDIPYNFSNSIDPYPIWREFPNLSITSPDYESIHSSPPDFAVTISGGQDIEGIFYTLNYTEKRYYTTSEGTINSDGWYALPDGLLILVFFVNDSYGLRSYETRAIFKGSGSDTPYPLILIIGGISLVILLASGLILRKKVILRKLYTVDKNTQFKIRKSVLNFGIKGGRLEIKEIAEETGKDRTIIIPVVKEMIKNKEIDAEYFKSSKSIVYNRQTASGEIDELIEEFKKWEEEKPGKTI